MDTVKQHYFKRSIPEGAYIMSRSEVLSHQWSLVENWKPQSDVWPLLHARGIMAVTTGLSSAYINHLFRSKLKARKIGLIPTLMISIASPSLICGLSQTLVLNKLLLLENTCTFCLEFRGAVMQTAIGVFLPVFTVPILNFMMIRNQLPNMPHLKDVKKMFTTSLRIYRPLLPNLALIFTFHVLFSGFMTNLQIKSFFRILNLHYLIEQEDKSTRVHKK